MSLFRAMEFPFSDVLKILKEHIIEHDYLDLQAFPWLNLPLHKSASLMHTEE